MAAEFEYTYPHQQNTIIRSCVFLDAHHFMTVDSQLVLKLWRVFYDQAYISRENWLAGFEESTICLLNINKFFCAIYDTNQLRVYDLIQNIPGHPSYPFLNEKPIFEFSEYKIKKVIAIPNSDQGLLLVLTHFSQIVILNSKQQLIINQFSLLNIPYLAQFFGHPIIPDLDPRDLPIPTSDIIIDDSTITSFSFEPSNELNHQQSYSPQVSQSQSSLQHQDSLFTRLRNCFKQKTQNNKSSVRYTMIEGDELKGVPNLLLGIIMDEKYFFYIGLIDLLRKNFNQISVYRSLPTGSKCIKGLFHPLDRDVLIFITDEQELVFFDFKRNIVKRKWRNSVNFLNLTILSIEKQYYLFANCAFSTNLFAPIEKNNFYDGETFPLRKVRESTVHQVITFPKTLYQTLIQETQKN